MANSSAEQVQRLQLQLDKIVDKLQKTIATNLQLEKTNQRLETELAKQTNDSARFSLQSGQFKLDLDRLSQERGKSFDGQQRLKMKLNETMSICREQHDEILLLKKALEDQRAISNRSTAKLVPLVSSAENDDGRSQEIAALKSEVKKLEDELFESYDLIDELEFEMDQIGFLEADNERLQEELRTVHVSHTASDERQSVDMVRSSMDELWAADRRGGAHSSANRPPLPHRLPGAGKDDGECASVMIRGGVLRRPKQVDEAHQKLVQRSSDKTSAVDDATAASTPTALADNYKDDRGTSDDDVVVSSRRRIELHKKLESMHEKHSRRSMDLLEQFRHHPAPLTHLPPTSEEADALQPHDVF